MIDIQNDENLEVLKDRLSDPTNSEAVELLKTASIDADFNDIVDSAFADKENRRFPIYSPEMAAISALYVQGQDVDPLVKEACENALKEWNIDGITTESLVKVASEDSIPDDLFLLASEKKLPVIDEATLEKSASTLLGNLSSLPIADRVEASTKLYKIATEEYNVDPSDIHESVVRYAQEASCDLNKLAMSVSERFAETQMEDYKGMIPKIASLKEELGGSVSFDKSVNSGIAYDLFMLDKEAGATDIFDAVYDVFNNPFFEQEDGTLEKSASTNSVSVGSYSIPEDELYKVAQEDMEFAFPGFSGHVFEDGVISMNKLESSLDDMTAEAKNAIGKYLVGE